MDEIQTGFGRTGKLWGFEHYGMVPDIVLLGKALGGGMPMGAFIAAEPVMNCLTHDPVLGHITTFGGHPVCCAAGMAALQVMIDESLLDGVVEKEALFKKLLVHPYIKAVRSKGLLMAVQLEHAEQVTQVIRKCLDGGVFTDWFLFASDCIRIAPPLTITPDEIREACKCIVDCLNEI